jgi:hypothetical protein
MDTIRFDLISLLFTALALLGLPRLLLGWRALLAPELTDEGKGLAVYLAIFWGVPLATLGHELGHLVVARALGAADATMHYRIFWGYVEYRTPLTWQEHWWVALAGNAVSWTLSALALWAAPGHRPSFLSRRPALHTTLRTFGLLEMVHTVVAYPLLSLGDLPGADWSVIYGRPFWVGTVFVAFVHAGSLLWLRRELREGMRSAENPPP